MPSIDERVVAMSFENAKFEAGVAQTMATLSKLDTSLKNIGSTNGLQNIEAAANKVTLDKPMSLLDKLRAKLSRSGEGAAQGLGDIDRAGNKVTLEGPSRAVDKLQSKMGQLSAGSTFTDIEKASDRVELSGLTRALNNVTNQFSVLQGAASVAMGNIAAQASMKGASFAKGFAFGPINDGLNEYKTNLGSIQTILANTEGQQVSGLDQVKSHLNELNTYSDQTIYNFSEMAKNIGTFTAAGVDMDTATDSIKGIANLAALSGSNSQQASTAMYQLSQAISAGRVGLQDWNSVVNAGMGGAVFQKSLMKTAVAMGKIPAEAVKIDKATGKATVNGESFRNSIMAKPGQESWLTSDVLTTSLKNFTGDMKEADLIAQGFTKTQAHSIMQQAATAKAAATEVKTLSQAFDVAKETIGSGWAKTFELIFGDFKESKKTFTAFSNALNGFINNASNARNKVLGEWKKLGGRTVLIEGIKQAFENLMAILGAVRDAFRDIFPATTGKQLFEMTKNFAGLMKSLTPSPELLNNLTRIFRGLFAVLHIGWSIIKGVAGVIGDLLSVVGKGSGGVLNFAGSIGDFLVAIDAALTKGGLLKGLFGGITEALKVPIKLIQLLASAVLGLFGGNEGSKAQSFASGLNQVASASGPLSDILHTLTGAWNKLADGIDRVKQMLEPWLSQAASAFSNFGHMVADKFNNMDWGAVFGAIQTGLLGGLFLMIRKFLKGGLQELGGGLLGNLSGVFKALTGNLQVMQQQVKAKIILEIAAAVGILAAAVTILSQLDPKALNRGMSAIAVGLGELVGAMALLSKVSKGTGLITMPLMAASMVGLAAAMLILAAAVKIFSTMSWDELLRGLTGVGGALVAIGVGVRTIGPGMGRAALGIIPLALGLNLLAIAVKQFATLSLSDLGKGLGAVAVSLGLIAAAVSFMPPTMPLIGAGLVALGFGLTIVAAAVGAFGSMDIKALVQGLLGTAGAIIAIGMAVALIPPTLALQAAGLVILGVALTEIAGAVGIMGKLKIATLIKGISGLAAVLVVLSVGLYAMSGTLPGSVALLAAATALAVLGPALGFLGSLDILTIVKGLAAMAAVFGVLALVGATLAVPLAALGGALLPLMGVMALAAAAAVAFGFALKLMGDNGVKAVAATIAALLAFVAALPKIVTTFLQSIVTIAESIVQVAPKILAALGQMLTQVINFVISQAPSLAVAIGVLLSQFLKVVKENTPKIVEAGFTLITNFLSGLQKNLPGIIRAGLNIVISFLKGVASSASRIVATAGQVVVNFLTGINAQLPKVVGAGVRLIVKFLNSVADKLPGVIQAGIHLIVKFIEGISNGLPKVVAAGVELVGKFIRAAAKAALKLVDVGFTTVLNFMNGLAKAIRKNTQPLIDAGFNLADAIIDGMVLGFKQLGHKAVDAVGGVVKSLPNAAKKVLGIHSPSTVFREIGENIMHGLSNGVLAKSDLVNHSMGGALKAMIGETGDAKKLGRFLGNEFLDGLTNAVDPRSAAQQRIDESFTALRGKLTEQTNKINDQLKSDREKLKTELGKEHPSQAIINSLTEDIRRDYGLLESARKASKSLMDGFADEKKQLLSLSATYDAVGVALDKAQQTLEDATRARDDAIKSYSDQYSALPDIDSESKDQVAAYKKALQEQIDATEKYMATLQKLRDLGLDDTTYKKLLAEGTKDQTFAEQLLAGGKDSVDELNKLDTKLTQDATALAQDAAKNLYQAGVDAAQGLVDGLKAQHDAIQAQMDSIAKGMVNSIKRQLGIRSPSRVMAEVGKFTAQGVIQGLKDSSQAVAVAAAGIGDDAASAMSDSLSHISNVLNSEIDPDLTITPVLDLSQVQKDAKRLGELTNVTPITAAASYVQASAASQEVSVSQDAQAAHDAALTVLFEQNNYSPEALSDVEIYRKTNNQLSQLRSALGLATA